MKPLLVKFLLVSSITILLALTAVLPARANYSNTVMSLHPVAYWRLNEPAFPVVVYPTGTATNVGSVGADANGTYIHSPVLQQPSALAGDPNPAAYFATPDQDLQIPYNSAFNAPGSFTIEFWAKKTNFTASATAAAIMNVGTNGSTTRYNGFLLYGGNAGTTWQFRTYVGTTRYQVVSDADTVVLDQWTHVVGVHDSAGTGTNYLYLNGVLAVVPLGNAGYAPQTGWPMTVANGPNDGEPLAFGFPGLLDEVAFYTNALSADQILAHYNAGITPSPATPYATLVKTTDRAAGYWRLDEPALPPKPGLPPSETASNLGSMGAVANGTIDPGTGVSPGAPGVRYSGFEATNTGCYFDGSGQIDCGNDTGFDFLTSISIAAWVKSDGILTYMNILAKGGNLWRFNINNNANTLAWVYPGGGITGTTPVADGQWHHVVAVAGVGQAAIYVDGKLDTTSGTGYSGSVNTDHVYIGSQGSVGSYRWKGTLDEVALYDTVLTADQVKQLYADSQVPPVITQQPQAPPPPVYEGMSASFSVAALGVPPLNYQWTKNGAKLLGKTTNSLALSNLTTTDSGSYAVVITNAYGAVTSSIVAVTVLAGPPVIAQQPQPAQRLAGGSATFTILAYGSAPLSYQWSFNGTPISGATSAAYTVSQVGTGDVGNYTVRVSNPFGFTNSAAAALSLVPSGAYAAEVAASGPVSYWRFDETSGTTANDYMGGVNGVNVAVAYGTNGPLPSSSPVPFVGMENTNKAYTFDGASSEVQLPKSFALNRTAFSIVAWVRADPTTAYGYQCIMAQGGNLWRFHLDSSAATLELVTAGLGGGALLGTIPVVDGNWHQVAAVFDGARKYLYVDGLSDGSMSSGGFLSTNADIVTIGSQGSYRWLGNIDEVAVYNRGLSESEVVNLYRAATSSAGAPQIVTQPVSQTVFAGQPASLSVTVEGGAPYSYQWKHAGTNLPGATKQTLTIPSVFYTDAGTYSVTVTGAATPAATSQPATLKVVVPPELTLFANVTNNLVLHRRSAQTT